MMNEQVPSDRRPYLTDPGDSLLLPGSPIEASYTYTQYQHATGVPHEDLVTSTLVAVPIPVPPRSGFGDTRRWPSTRPEMMWHPLLWLPGWVTGRYEFDGRRESDDEFVLRVALQLSESGLYDPGTGTWMDILAASGLDTDDPSDVERVRRWLSGGEDALLDSMDELVSDLMDMAPVASQEAAEHLGVPYEDLVAMMLEYDELHNHRASRQTLPTLRECSWAMTADAMLGAVDDLSTGDVGTHAQPMDYDTSDYTWVPGTRRSLTETFLQLTGQFLTGSDEVPRLKELVSQVATFDGGDHELISGPVAAFREVLQSARTRYWPSLEELQADVDQLLAAEQEAPAT